MSSETLWHAAVFGYLLLGALMAGTICVGSILWRRANPQRDQGLEDELVLFGQMTLAFFAWPFVVAVYLLYRATHGGRHD